MSDMCACHQKILVANRSGAAFGAPAVDGTIFANNIFVPDVDLRFSFGRKGKVLWRRADDCAMADEIAGADYDFSFDNGVRLNDGSISNSYLRTDHREWTDLGARADLRAWCDNCPR